MADEKKKDKKETINGREVQHYADGRASIYTDNGEVFDAVAATEYALLYAGDNAAAVKHEAINPQIQFWVKSYTDKHEEEQRNPVRGYVLGFFEPPESFRAEDDADEEDEKPRQRLACWMKLALPSYVKDANKAVVLAPVGTIVWVDITHANTAIVRAAMPKASPNGGIPTSVVEVQIEPLRRVSFPSKSKPGETWSAWRMRVSGGWRQAADDIDTGRKGGFRILDSKAIQTLANRLVPPEILNVEGAAQLAGVKAPLAPALPQGPSLGSVPALPASSASAN